MVVIAIIGILAAIGIPSYQQYRIKANRAEAQAYLMDLAQRQQQYLLDARAFAGTVGDLGGTTPENVARHYTITLDVDAGPPPTFVATAAPIAGGMQDGDGDLTIDQAGTKEWNGQSW